MKLYIKQKVFSFVDKFFIYDGNEEALYYCEGEFFTLGKKLHLYDLNGKELRFIHQELLSFLPRYYISDGVNDLAEVVKRFTLFYQKYEINGLSWEVEGDFLAHEYVIRKGNNAIATISKRWFTWGDAYESVSTSFTDVSANEWFYSAVIWAEENNIVEGYGNGKFGPNDYVTREQLAKILYGYAKYKGINTNTTSVLTMYTDRGKVSSWALTSVKWANKVGIINGKGNGILDPLGYATRAEAATMLQRYCTKVQ